jgi:hypothetical protein
MTCTGPVELAFDRLLLPVTVTRQSIFLSDTRMPPNFFTPTMAYDPVARVVRITPDKPFTVGQTYRVQISSPSSPTDPSGLHAIDGATLDPALQGKTVEFMVTAAATAPPTPPVIDFCKQVSPQLASCGNLTQCHINNKTPAVGLVLSFRDLPATRATAIGRVAEESNTGPVSQGQPASRLFGQDMPIIDPGDGTTGDPGNSWLLYKTLMASNAAPGLTTTANAHSVSWTPLSDTERATLSGLIPGREMPIPPLAMPLSVDQLETISLWIAQGARVPDTCP